MQEQEQEQEQEEEQEQEQEKEKTRSDAKQTSRDAIMSSFGGDISWVQPLYATTATTN